MSRLRVAVIGVGHLGKEHARILSTLTEVELVGVADTNTDQAQAVARRCNTRAYADYWPLLNLVDAATIAVPTTYHRHVGVEFLKRGLPVLIEKPLAPSLEQCDELLALSRQHDALLQVGHIERFNPALLELEQCRLRPKYVEAERLGTFSGRSLDIGVVLDLMIHDIDVLLSLVRAPVRSVEALGVSLFGVHEDIANARITFENGCVANLSASRAGQKPVRNMRLYSAEGYVSLDFHKRHATMIQPSALCRSRGLDARKLDASSLAHFKERLFGQLLEIRERDLKEHDQLTMELQHFVNCVRTHTQPKVSGRDGRDAVALAMRIIEKIQVHQWEGHSAGPVGPTQLPVALGPLFTTAEPDAEAA
jgi:predicted dehydrogenase